MSEGAEQQEPSIVTDNDRLAGVWATEADAVYADETFTIDFIRIDPFVPPPGRGIRVARVALPPQPLSRLLDRLEYLWSEYARTFLPRELYGGEETSPEDRP